MMDTKKHQIDESEKDFKKIRVNLSKIRKLRYNDIEELTRLEKILLIMAENKKKKLHELSKGDKELKITVKKLEDLSKDPDIVSYYNEQKLEEIARQMDLEAARKEATKYGYEDGYKSGRTSGFEEGHSSGKKDTQIETAKRMLREGLEINMISKISGLSKEEIEGLK